MNKKFWYDIHSRGVDTVAVWTTFAPTVSVGEFTLAAHSVDVNLFNSLILDFSQAEDALNLARASRDASGTALKQVCVRALKLISGTLKPTDNLLKEVRSVTSVTGESQGAMNEKCFRLVSLWIAVNTHRATLLPAQSPLSVDTTDVTSFQSMLGNHAMLVQTVATKRTLRSQKLSALKAVATKVDQNNKRWYKAWQGQFAAGTPQRDALSLINTGASQTLPGQGVFLTSELLPGQGVSLSFDAARATQFTLLHKGPGEPAFSVLADGLTTKTFEHEATPPGAHSYKVVGGNAVGQGAESVPLELTVAEELAA
jgi:hypothetical protein